MSGIGDSFARVVTDGPFVVAALVAAVAGLVSFLSPCVLPLVPGYLSYVGGLSGTEVTDTGTDTDAAPAGGGVATRARVRSRTVLGAVLFVLGFTVVFVAYGVLFGRLGGLLIEHQRLLERILGVVVILLGLAFLGWLPGVSRELRIHRFPSAGLIGAPLLGIVFGLGWTPCIG
ncbi:MAG TPA: cytochrome c biogenesis protein CcdA, partial [Mycobacteriales bacterium]|nr:cytochrome c biogenesis protein CcdA [Mycobacteriales bacterium]